MSINRCSDHLLSELIQIYYGKKIRFHQFSSG